MKVTALFKGASKAPAKKSAAPAKKSSGGKVSGGWLGRHVNISSNAAFRGYWLAGSLAGCSDDGHPSWGR